MKRILGAGLVVAWVWLGLIPGAWAKTKPKPLRIYSIDVEGGQATLIVAPRVNPCWWIRDGRALMREMPRAL